jgi:membrane fusion protein, heavy metal efflux system
MMLTQRLKAFPRLGFSQATLTVLIVILAIPLVALLLYRQDVASVREKGIVDSNNTSLSATAPVHTEKPAQDDPVSPVFGESKATASDRRMQTAHQGKVPNALWSFGKLQLNKTRTARVSSRADGVVAELCVEVGQEVEAGQVIAFVESRNVGGIKSNLVESRLALQRAKDAYERHKVAHETTDTLMSALRNERCGSVLEHQYRDRRMGTQRKHLVTALAELKRADANHERVQLLSTMGVIPGKEAIQTKCECESAEANYRALLEQIALDSDQQLFSLHQSLQEAQAALTLNQTQLLILGYSASEIESMDPSAEGERISQYPVRTPIAGTVTANYVALSQHVDAKSVMVEISDLSSLWLEAAVSEHEMRILQTFDKGTVSFSVHGNTERTFSAKVLTIGDVIDDEIRTTRLLAVADNKQQGLKPGMVVEVYLTAGSDNDDSQIISP